MMHMERIERLAGRCRSSGLLGMVVHSRANRRWLSGYAGAGALFVAATGEAFLIVDFRFLEDARASLGREKQLQVIESPRDGEDLVLAVLLKGRKKETIAVEMDHISASRHHRMRRDWEVALTEGDQMLSELRAVKDSRELEMIRASQELAEYALKQSLECVRPGVTERQIEAQLTWHLLENGAENGIFGIVVGSGPNAALPHAVPGPRRLEKADCLLIDFGAIYQGYYSDITRTFCVGAVDEKFKEVYDIVLDANCRAIAAIEPGMEAGQLDQIARDLIREAGYGDYFRHGLGHGVGLDIHESPWLRPDSSDLLKAGNVLTVEPGIYLPGEFGIRIEDLILVTEEGHLNLTSMTKELVVLS